MDFLEALRHCGGSLERLRSPVVTAKTLDSKERVKIYRPEWRTINYPAKYVWVTSTNIPMRSIGGGQSAPLLLEVPDFLADDWEVYDGND